MKKISFLLFFLCFVSIGIAQQTEERNLSDFNNLYVTGAFDIYLKKGTQNNLKIETKGDLELSEIEVQVKGQTLEIRNKRDKYNWNDRHGRNDKAVIYITYKELRKLDMSGAGNIYTDNPIETQDFTFRMSGAGNFKAEVKAKTLDIDFSGAGNMEISGTVDEQTVELSGAGNYRAFDLQSKHANIRLSGAGNMQVFVSETLEANNGGVGSIKYRGNPRKVTADHSFLGSVKPD